MPVAMAARGIDGYSASLGSCTRIIPPDSLTARTPIAPSAPAPVRMMAKPSPCCSASERKKKINWRYLTARLIKFRCRYFPIRNMELARRCNHIHMVRFQPFRRRDLHDRHAGARRKNVRQFAMTLWIEMHHDHEGGAGCVGERFKESLQGVNAARRGTDTHDHRLGGGPVSPGRSVHAVAVVCHGAHPAEGPATASFEKTV